MIRRPARTVDARGRLCPVPTVLASLALDEMAAGDVLELLADDPVTRRDLPAWCGEFGHRVLDVSEAAVHFTLSIQKNGPTVRS